MNKMQYKKNLAKRKQKYDEMSVEFIRLIHQLTPEGCFVVMSAVADLTNKIISVGYDMDEYTEKKLAIYNSEQRHEAIKELNSCLGFTAVEEMTAVSI